MRGTILTPNPLCLLCIQVVASAQGQRVGQAQGAVGEAFELQVPSANLWSPDSPFLYDLEVQLLGNQQGMVSMLAFSVSV